MITIGLRSCAANAWNGALGNLANLGMQAYGFWSTQNPSNPTGSQGYNPYGYTG